MANTKARTVFDSFEASFQDKRLLSEEVERIWLLKAIGRYSIELDPLVYDEEMMEFDSKLSRYTIDTLAAMMKQFYQERELSKVNKNPSVVTKDISIDGSNGAKTAAKNELDYTHSEVEYMIANQMPTYYT